MSFLTPWFLLGAAAIAGPILFHLIRQSVRERMPFSSLMFLRPTTQRVTRRRKLEDWWLLLLRCLCVLLLAAGFARPFFTKHLPPVPAASEGRQLILLVDTSASMRREGVWDLARARADQYLDQAAPGDEVAIFTFDRQPHPVVTFADWAGWVADQRAALARQRLAAVAPGWMGTQLGLALTDAAEKFTEDTLNGRPVSRRELVLISDLQEGAKLDGLQGHDWPAGLTVTLERVDARPLANAGLEIQNPSGEAGPVRVRVTNARDSDRVTFHLAWNVARKAAPGAAAAGGPMEIYLPPGQTRTFSAPPLPAGTTTAELQLTGDEVDFDNRAYYAAPEVEHLTIAWFGPDAGHNSQTMRFYLERVFAETPARQVNVVSPEVQSVFSPELLNQAAFAVIPGRLAPEETSATHDWLARGKTALFVVIDEQSAAPLAALTGLPALDISEATGDYALFGTIDFTHPLFAPFAGPRFSDFTHIHFWKHRRLEIPPNGQARVLATFDDGAPALVQFPVGQGNLLVLAAGWNPADSQFALSSKFPLLMQVMLDWSVASVPARFQFETGEVIPSPVSAGGAAVVWETPDGKKTSLAAATGFNETDGPGIYTATFGEQRRQYAVNLPLEESRTAPMSPDELSRLGVPLQALSEVPLAQARQRQLHVQQAELENQQKVWRWLLAGVLVLLFAEIILSGWLARRPLTTGGPA
jgi:hypothetical protein